VADSSTVNLSFVLYRNSQPLAAVILCSKYQWDTVAIANTMEACKKAKIPCLRFMREFRNSADYVVDRINSVLR
jgi:spore maturation protein CgeB